MILEGKVAIVTGAARGIGRGYTEALLEKGAKVTIADVLEEKGQETKQELCLKYGDGKVMFIKSDVTNNEDLRGVYTETIQKFGHPDIVINNAGIIDEINFERTFDVNLKAVVASSYMAVSHMRKDKGGKGGIIINISSSINSFSPATFLLAYTASKAGNTAFSKGLAANLKDVDKYGIRVASLLPWLVDTDMVENLTDFEITQEDDVTQPLVREAAAYHASSLDQFESIGISTMAKAMLELVYEPESNGAVLLVTPEGAKYTYPEKLVNKVVILA